MLHLTPLKSLLLASALALLAATPASALASSSLWFLIS